MMLETSDRAPETAVAGDRPVIAHHVELPARDVEWVLPGGTRYPGPERVVWRQVWLAEPPAVDVEDAACRVNGLARQRDDALDEVGPRRPATVVARWVGEYDDVALAQLVPVEERLLHHDPVMDIKRQAPWRWRGSRRPGTRTSGCRRPAAVPARGRWPIRLGRGAARAAPCAWQAGRPPRAQASRPGHRARRRSQQCVMLVTAGRCGAPSARPGIGGPGVAVPRAGAGGRCASGPRSPR